MALSTEFSSHEVRTKKLSMRCTQLRDILDALMEISESDSWIQELHHKSGALDYNKH